MPTKLAKESELVSDIFLIGRVIHLRFDKAWQIGRFWQRGESPREGNLGDGQRDIDRHLANARQGGINPPQLKVLLRNLFIQSFGGGGEHFIRNAGCLRGRVSCFSPGLAQRFDRPLPPAGTGYRWRRRRAYPCSGRLLQPCIPIGRSDWKAQRQSDVC